MTAPAPATGAMLNSAADLWARGFSLIPVHVPIAGVCSCGDPACGSPGKHPSIKWEPYQTVRATDEQVFDWFGNGTPRNIGIVTGAVSVVVVVDTDSPEAETYAETHLPDTPMQVQTAKGRHRYYRHPGVPVRNRARIDTGDPAVKIDVRGDGGFVVGPGSLHASGATYQRLGDWPAIDALPVFDPAWLSRPEDGTCPNLPSRGTGTIPEGQRNAALTARAGQLRRLGLSVDAMTAALVQENRERCDPPLGDREVAGIARSIGRHNPTVESPHGLVLFDDVAILSRPEPDYIIDGRLVAGSHGMTAGPSGAGKTFVEIGKAVAIASGTPWLGAAVRNPGPVVYVLTEAAKLRGRISAAKLAAGLPLDVPIGLYILPMPVNLSESDQVQPFIDRIVTLKPRLVVIDTLSRCMSGEENSKTETAIVVAHTDQIRARTGAAAWWVHHTNANDSRERGSTTSARVATRC